MISIAFALSPICSYVSSKIQPEILLFLRRKTVHILFEFSESSCHVITAGLPDAICAGGTNLPRIAESLFHLVKDLQPRLVVRRQLVQEHPVVRDILVA